MTVFIAVPCFNEGSRWSTTYWSRLMELPDFRWIFVDDGSSDNTRSLIEFECEGTPNRLITQPRNLGKAEAVRLGMLTALSEATDLDVIGFMDADGAFNVGDIQRLAQVMTEKSAGTQQIEAVWSSRVALAGRDIQRTPKRHYLGRVAATVLSWGDNSIPYDTQSGYKLFRPTPNLRHVLSEPFMTRWLFEVEMLERFKRQNERSMVIWEEPVDFWQEIPGSKVSPREFVRIGQEIISVKYGAR